MPFLESIQIILERPLPCPSWIVILVLLQAIVVVFTLLNHVLNLVRILRKERGEYRRQIISYHRKLQHVRFLYVQAIAQSVSQPQDTEGN